MHMQSQRLKNVPMLSTGDHRTARDNLAFILGWLKLFPRLAHNHFWIAGESYAGKRGWMSVSG